MVPIVTYFRRYYDLRLQIRHESSAWITAEARNISFSLFNARPRTSRWFHQYLIQKKPLNHIYPHRIFGYHSSGTIYYCFPARSAVNQIKKDVQAICADKRFVWARNATVLFARGIQQRLTRPGRYALADG